MMYYFHLSALIWGDEGMNLLSWFEFYSLSREILILEKDTDTVHSYTYKYIYAYMFLWLFRINPWKRKGNNMNVKERSTKTILEITVFKINVLR